MPQQGGFPEEPVLAPATTPTLTGRGGFPTPTAPAGGPAPAADATRVFELRLRTGLSESLIRAHRDEIETEVRRRDFDPELFRRTYPKLEAWLAEDATTAAAATPHLPQLQAIEHTLSFGAAIQRGVDQVQGLTGGYLEALGEFYGLEGLTTYGREVRARNRREADARGARLSLYTLRGPWDLAQYVKETVGEQLPLMAPSLAGSAAGAGLGSLVAPGPGTLVGGVIGALVPSFVLGVGEVQSTLKDLDPTATAPTTVFVGGSAIAALDSVVPGRIGSMLVRAFGRETAELVAKRALLQPVAAGWIRTTAGGTVRGMATEGLTEAIQAAIGEVAGSVGAGTPMDWTATGWQMLEEGAAGALLGGLVEGGTAAATVRRRNAQAAAAQQQVEFFTSLATGVESLALLKTAPAAAREFFQRVTRDGPVEFVYAPTDRFVEYFQGKGISPALVAQTLTGRADALEQALAQGVDLQIPTAEYAVTLAGTEHHAAFVKELRLGNPRQMNVREVEQLTQLVAVADEAAGRAEADQVTARDELVARLETALGGVYTPDQAAGLASLLATRYETRARRLRRDPVAVLETAPPDVLVERGGTVDTAPLTIAPSRAPRGETADQRLRRRELHLAALTRQLTREARRLDPAVDAETIRRELEFRLALEEERQAATRESGTGQDLLRAIAAAGGLWWETRTGAYKGEVEHYLESGRDIRGVAAGSGRVLHARGRATYNGVPGVFNEEGLTPDGVVEALRQDPRFEYIADINDLFDALDQALRAEADVDALPGTDELRALGIVPGTRWWGESWAAPIIDETEPVGEVDDTFDPEEFQQRARYEKAKQARAAARATRQLSANQVIRQAQRAHQPLERVVPERATAARYSEFISTASELMDRTSARLARMRLGTTYDERHPEYVRLSLFYQELQRVIDVAFDRRAALEAQAGTQGTLLGETQPTLPGAEGVREQEIATPALELPFSLTSEVSTAKKGRQGDLFQLERALEDHADTLVEPDSLADLQARGFDTSRVYYHQTSIAAAEAIKREGFDLTKGRARLTDEQVPDGVFFKPDTRDLGLTRSVAETEQLQVYLRFGETRRFTDRRGLENYVARRDAEYDALVQEARRYDAAQAKEFDRRWAQLRELDKARDDRAANKAEVGIDAFLAEWRAGNEARAGAARARMTAVLRAEGVETVVLERDEGSFGRVTETIITIAGGQVALAELGQHQELFQREAFHGSPHVFDRFSLQAVGSGQGAQMFGWGLYFADLEQVANHYREELAGRGSNVPTLLLDGEPIYDEGRFRALPDALQDGLHEVQSRLYYEYRQPEALAHIRRVLEISIENAERDRAEFLARGKDLPGLRELQLQTYRHALEFLQTYGDRLTFEPPYKPGRTYKVALPDETDFLDWDKPASEQPPKVQAALRALGVTWRAEPPTLAEYAARIEARLAEGWQPGWGRIGDEMRARLEEGLALIREGREATFRVWLEETNLLDDATRNPTGEQIYQSLIRNIEHDKGWAAQGYTPMREHAAKLASELLREHGIAGTQYLDQGSRAAGTGSHNYVVFDDSRIEILEFYQRGDATPARKPWAYSRLVRAVEASMQTKASGAQWKATIKNSKAGISQDEFLLASVADLEDATTYTRDEVLQYLEANRVAVDTVVLGEVAPLDVSAVTTEADRVYQKRLDAAEMRALEENIDEGPEYLTSDDVTFRGDNEDGWAGFLPGGRGALEEQLTSWWDTEEEARAEAESELETRNAQAQQAFDADIRDRAHDAVDYAEIEREVRERLEAERGDGLEAQFESYVLSGPKAADSYREVFLSAPTFPIQFVGLTPAENAAIPASVRQSIALWRSNQKRLDVVMREMSLATDPRQQAALRKLYEQPDKAIEFQGGWEDGHTEYSHIENPIVRLRFDRRTLADGRTALFLEELQPPADEQQARMPPLFLKNWRELGFKWAIAHAAELQVDVLAWTTGQQQADRYRLEKHVDEIEYYPETRQLAGYRHGRRDLRVEEAIVVVDPAAAWRVVDNAGNVVAGAPTREAAEQWLRLERTEITRQYDVAPEDLPRYIGKELADRLLAQPAPVFEIVEGTTASGRVTWRITENGAPLTRLGGMRIPPGGYVERALAERALTNVIAAAPKTLAGADLKVGGEGLKRLYDVDFPAVVNKLVKRTGARVESAQVRKLLLERPAEPITIQEGLRGDATPVFFVIGEAGNRLLGKSTRAEAEAWARASLADAADTVHALPITPAVRELVASGQPLFQDEGDQGDIKGAYNPATNTIRLIAGKADLSTFLHESGHAFLEELFADASSLGPEDLEDASLAQVRADADTVLRWFGFQGTLEEWRALPIEARREHHEQFARGFEAYLRDGRAPSFELRAVFAQFRAWLVAIYRNLRQLKVELTPEVRGVMDRLLASDEAIAAAQAETEFAPLFGTAADAGVDEAGFAALQTRFAEARRQAHAALDKKLLADQRRETQAWWQQERDTTRRAVVEEVMQEPALRAQSVIRTGKLPNGEIPEYGDGRPIKLSKADVLAGWGQATLKALRMGRDYLYAVEGGLPVATVAELTGFPTADALLAALRGAPRVDQVIEEETDRRMRERHGDLLLEPLPLREAAEAAVTDARFDVVSEELRLLSAKAAVQASIPPRDVLVANAETRIARTTVRELRPGLFLMAAQQASRRAFERAAAGDLTAAVAEKQRELFSLGLYTAARNAKERINQRRKRLHEFDTNAKLRGRLGKAGQDYLDQVDAFLERYEFRKVTYKSLERRESLRKWIAKLQEQGLPVELPEDVLDDARHLNYQELTVEEFEGVFQAIEQIAHLARLKNRLLKASKQREFKAATGEIETSLRDNEDRLPRPYEGARKIVEQFTVAHLKIATLARIMDGYTEGPLFDYVIRPLGDAAARELALKSEHTTTLLGLFDRFYSPAEQRAFYTRQYYPVLGDPTNANASLSKMERLMVLLNWGNETNRQRTRDGRGWTDDQVRAILDTLDRRDGAFAQAVWDYLDTWRPEIGAKQKRVTGAEPEWVEPTPVFTAWGELRGGYFPIVFDTDLSARAGTHEEASFAELQRAASYVSAVPRRNHVMRRAEGNVVRPVLLSFETIFRHVDRVIHDLTHHEVLIDVGRLLGDQTVSQAILDTHGVEVLRNFKQTLRDIAVGPTPARDGAEGVLTRLRNGATTVGLAWNVTTALLQPIGLTQSWQRLGGKWVLRGFFRYLGPARTEQRTFDWITAQSEFMRTRAFNINRELYDVAASIGLDRHGALHPGTWLDVTLRGLTGNRVTRQWVAQTFFSLLQKVQYRVDAITWLGAYEKAGLDPANRTEEGTLDEDRVRAIADQAVKDTQGGGSVMDLSPVQRNNALKLLTNFYSYFNVTYNLATLSARAARRRGVSGKTIATLAHDYLLLFVLPGALVPIIRDAMGGEDDPEQYLQDAILGALAAPLGTMLLVRELTGVLAGGFGYQGPAGTRAIAALSAFVRQAGQAVVELDPREIRASGLRGLNTAAGALFHYPAAQVDKTVSGAAALLEGDTSNPLVLVTGYRE